jgi:hypothetical protein
MVVNHLKKTGSTPFEKIFADQGGMLAIIIL